ncbi:auxin-responsive protein SAUR36-like [Ananas comosus]|uniref:Auxin-responsive protein SAUR36-like n=1 Tax=Ananas comosus TaxID=4615 RepID=A0A6P5GXU0_ANACO|nr:auxin-responsive protein SAUR36-like [Ananas comosus]
MIHSKRLTEIAEWRRTVLLGRRITTARREASFNNNICSSSVAEKGHFVVYAIDEKRFVVPLAYLNSRVFAELFKMSKEEFGLSSNGPIVLPCGATSRKYIMSLLERRVSKEVEKALLSSILTPSHSTCCLAPVEVSPQIATCSF